MPSDQAHDIRAAVPGDLPALGAMTDRCSFDTLYRRFHGATGAPLRRELERTATGAVGHRSFVAAVAPAAAVATAGPDGAVRASASRLGFGVATAGPGGAVRASASGLGFGVATGAAAVGLAARASLGDGDRRGDGPVVGAPSASPPGPVSPSGAGGAAGSPGGAVEVHGMATLARGRSGVVEVAFLVEDAWQRRGLGRALAGRLLAEARAWGATQLVAVVQADNDRAVRFVRAVAPGVALRFAGGAEFELTIPVPPAAA